MNIRNLFICPSLLLIGSLPCVSQDNNSDNKDKPLPQVCVIAVGAPSANIAEWKSETVFSFKATDKDAAPPMDFFFRNTERGKKKYDNFPLSLGVSTPPITTQNPLVLYKHSGPDPESGYAPGFKMPLLDKALLTAVIMWRDKAKPSWKEPNMLSVDASPASWPSGQIRVLNLSPMMIGLTTSEGIVRLKPKQSHSKSVASSTPYRYKIEAAVGGKAVFVCNSAISMPNQGRKLVVVFGNQRGQAEAMVIQIPMPLPPTTAIAPRSETPVE